MLNILQNNKIPRNLIMVLSLLDCCVYYEYKNERLLFYLNRVLNILILEHPKI